MGKYFGELIKIRRIAEFTLSPYEQKLAPHLISEKLPNTFRRIYEQSFRIGIPFTGAYLIYDWAETEYKKSQRKNPADYANDV